MKDKRLPGTIHSVAQAIRDAGGKAEGIYMDMREPESIGAGVAKSVETFGRLDIVVNNAAILVPGTIETIQPRHIDLIWQVDLRGPILLMREAIPHMRKQGGGRIINVSSVAGVFPGPGPYKEARRGGAFYGMVKAGLERLSQGLAMELQDDKITVNVLSPQGRIKTPGNLFAQNDPENPNLDFITKREKNALLSQTSEYLAALRMADFVITSTPYMKECIQRSFRGPVYLWRNAVDSESVHAASLATDKRAAPASPGTITIGYASGSRAHEADFRTIESVLLQVLQAHPNVRIQVIGYADLPETFKPYASRIATEPVATYPAYLGLLARCDIALVPLVIDEFNECKSAVRFLDAAAVRVPVIAAATGDFKNVVVHGKNGLLAANEAEWLQAIELLIGDGAKRREIADGAKRHAEAVRVSSETFDSFDTGVRRALDFRR